MKTFWVAITILVTLIGGGIALNICLDHLSEELLKETKYIEEQIEAEKFEEASESASKMSEFIDKKKTLMASILDHSIIDEIEQNISEVIGYSTGQDVVEARVSVKKLGHMFEHLPENYHLQLQNIL